MQHIHKGEEDFLQSLGKFVTECSSKAILDRGSFTVAFSGGSAATKICKAFELKEFSNAVDWSKWKIFFCDERYVSLTDPDSNFKAIDDGLLKKHPEIASHNVFALNKLDDIPAAAKDYEEKLQSVFKDCKFPSFDLVVLGMGPDGHICSLFPNHSLLDEGEKWIAFLENSPKPPPQRITFTLNVVNHSKEIIFITTGEGKAENIKKAIEVGPSKDIPASLVKPIDGNLHWFMDERAASLLSK